MHSKAYLIQNHSLSSGVWTAIISVAGPLATVTATTLHMYVLNGLIRAVTLIVFVVGKMLVIWVLLFNSIMTVYIRTMPFWWWGRGGSHERTSDLEVSALTWKFVGGPDGAAAEWNMQTLYVIICTNVRWRWWTTYSTYIIPTILMCSDCDSDVRSFINSHCWYCTVVCVVWVQWSNDDLSLFWCQLKDSPCLLLSDVQLIVANDSMMKIFRRVVPAQVDVSWIQCHPTCVGSSTTWT